MTTQSEVNDQLKVHLGNDEFVKLWWSLPILGLGKARPKDIWETDPDRIVEYVKDYGTLRE